MLAYIRVDLLVKHGEGRECRTQVRKTSCDPCVRHVAAVPRVCSPAGVPCPESNHAVGGEGGTLPGGTPLGDAKREDRRGDARQDLPHLAA